MRRGGDGEGREDLLGKVIIEQDALSGGGRCDIPELMQVERDG